MKYQGITISYLSVKVFSYSFHVHITNFLVIFFCSPFDFLPSFSVVLIFCRLLAALSICLFELLLFEEDVFSWTRCFGEYAYLGTPGPCAHLAGIKLMTLRLEFTLLHLLDEQLWSCSQWCLLGYRAECFLQTWLVSMILWFARLPLLIRTKLLDFFFFHLSLCNEIWRQLFSHTASYMVTFYPPSS